MQDNNKIVELISKYLNDELDEGGMIQLEEWKAADGENRKLFERIISEKYLFQEVKDSYKWEKHIWEKVDESNRVVGMSWRRLFVAAAVVLALGAGAYYYFNRAGNETIVKKQERPNSDIAAPANNRAVITLDNGRKIYLDSIQNGVLFKEGNANVSKLEDGKLVYDQNQAGSGQPVAYNTITNPRGSKVIDIRLEDGSHLWLNSESSIRFPISFTGNERKVEITGEVYFEVSEDKSSPFIVYKEGSDVEVQVLGTKFNVNFFDKAAKITLLEGSVKVAKPNARQTEILRPGMLAQVDDVEIKMVSNPDIEQVMAWKNGIFLMKNAELRSIMKDVERWYNVEAVYKAEIKDGFSGDISRGESLSKLLKILELTGEVKFSIEGNNIIVLPGQKN